MEDRSIEVKCKSHRCGAGPGVVVLHYFDTKTGQLLRTNKFRDVQQMFNSQKEKAV